MPLLLLLRQSQAKCLRGPAFEFTSALPHIYGGLNLIGLRAAD
jgi:hypothetical protein